MGQIMNASLILTPTIDTVDMCDAHRIRVMPATQKKPVKTFPGM